MATEEEIARAEELDNSSLFDVHRWSEHPEVNKAVNTLYAELQADPTFKGKINLTKKHIKVIILDLYVKWLADPTMYSSFHRASNPYSGIKKRYNKLHISRLTPIIVDTLIELGYIESVKGHHDKTGKRKSHMARMRATPKLINLIVDEHKITPEMIELAPNTECIILREKDGKKKKDIHYTDTPETKRMRKDLYAYNNLLRNSLIDIPYIPRGGLLEKPKKTSTKGKRKKPMEQRTTINRSDKFVRRIFSNGSWDDGGRFYGGFWQRVPKKWRERISINAGHTVEIDYSGLHIVMLYAQEGIDYWKVVDKDPYALPGLETDEKMRGLLKLILLCLLNNKDKATTIKAVRKKINYDPEEYGWVKEEGVGIPGIIDSFCLVHKPIEKYFYSGIGITLQRLDSRIAEYVINTLTKKGIPVLCVHDSFVVPTLDEPTLRDTMSQGFAMITGSGDPKTKTIGVDVSILETVQRSSGKAESEHNYWVIIPREYGVDLSEAYAERRERLTKHWNDIGKEDNIYYFENEDN